MAEGGSAAAIDSLPSAPSRQPSPSARPSAGVRAMFDEIGTRYRPREPVDPDDLADMVSSVLEGGIVMAKALNDPLSLKRQILAFRALVQALYVPLPEA
jgi:TetR/AcrR family transcriptional regulator, transcriptional repressor for nem operon